LQAEGDDADAAAVLHQVEVGRGPRSAVRVDGPHGGRQWLGAQGRMVDHHHRVARDRAGGLRDKIEKL